MLIFQPHPSIPDFSHLPFRPPPNAGAGIMGAAPIVLKSEEPKEVEMERVTDHPVPEKNFWCRYCNEEYR